MIDDPPQQRERIYVAVVIYRSLAIRLEVEMVDLVYIVHFRRGGLIRRVDRMLEREIPDRKCLELRVAGVQSSLVGVIQLR